MKYHLFRPWIRWIVPFPILVWYAKRTFWSVIWYQDEYTQIEQTIRYQDDK